MIACARRWGSCFERDKIDHMKKDEFKEFYREHLVVPLAGFGMAAVMLCLFLLLMTWLAEQFHHLQFCIGFGR